MLAGIHSGVVHLPGDTMYYVRFGSGSKTLVMLPGLGDGLTTVKGAALPMALLYRAYGKDYTVYMFSRRNHLSENSTTRSMACDLKQALDALHIGQIDLIGVSMGGMIAQHFAADYPQCVNKLVLVVTCAAPNPLLIESVHEWISLARQGSHTALMDSNVRRIYSAAYYSKNRWLIPIMGRFTKPASYERFLIQAQACLGHNAADRLPEITMSTLVIGGEQDLALGGEASRELAASLPRAKLKMYPQWGHGLYEEAKDFHAVVLDFLRNS